MSAEAMKLALEALKPVSTFGRVGSRDVDTAKAQEAIKALEEALAKQEQGEPAVYIPTDALRQIMPPLLILRGVSLYGYRGDGLTPLYTTPQQRKPLWIDPNDKTQAKFLPNIGEPVLFCNDGKTYHGKHNGGSFECRGGIAKRYFNTWECRWMHLPAAHGIKE